MSLSLHSGSRCLVTGATEPKSIGYACAQQLLKAGAAHVTIMGRNESKVNAAIESLKDANSDAQVSGVVGDLKEPDSMAPAVQKAVDQMNGGLDILVISGGNGGSEYLGLDAKDAASYHLMNVVSVVSPLFLTNAAVPHLTKSSAQGGGTVVMVSSIAPNVPWPDTAPFNYSKAAQNCMVETLAFQHRADNVRVNAVLAGCIHTGALDRMAQKKNIDIQEYAAFRAESHPIGRNGTPEEVAQAVVFLASPASSFITGELIKLDGGLHLSNWFNKPKMLAQFKGGTD